MIEENHDDNGPLWSMNIAPFQAHICALKAAEDSVKTTALKLYEDLKKAGIEVIIDDREDVRAGEMFADADLISAPIRLIVSPRNLENDMIEIKYRMVDEPKDLATEKPINQVVDHVKKLITQLSN